MVTQIDQTASNRIGWSPKLDIRGSAADLRAYEAALRKEGAQEVEAALSDSAAVHVNMLRGGIAKPSPANIWHIYGAELVDAMPADMKRGIQQEVLAKLRDLPSKPAVRFAEFLDREYTDIMNTADARNISAALADALEGELP